MAKEYIISVDLGGTKILTALLNQKNEILNRIKTATDITKGPDFIMQSMAESVLKLIKQSEVDEKKIYAVSVGVPGTVNPNTGKIGNAPNLQIISYNVKKALKKYFDFPVLIENDVNLAALGIKRFEFNNKLNNCLVVFVGTGIGGALIINGKLYRGSTYFAGEIGHMKVNKKGEFSTNPKDGTFENIASRTAIVEAIKKDIANGKSSVLAEVEGKKGKIKSKALASAVVSKDKVAVKHVNRACKVIGTVLGSLTTLLNIDTIVLGGGVIEAMGEYMIGKIEKSFNSSVLPEPGKAVKLVVTNLGDDAPLFGGVELANEFMS